MDLCTLVLAFSLCLFKALSHSLSRLSTPSIQLNSLVKLNISVYLNSTLNFKVFDFYFKTILQYYVFMT